MTGIDTKEVQRIREAVEPIASQYGIEKMYLFGSRARGDNGQNSDFDFFIHAGDIKSLFQISRLMRDLQISLKGDVDIVTSGGLKKGNPIIGEIERDGVLVYEK
ncbi:MAG: nucleotidyltransferase domain-containing protein [Candidatus Methanoplasma sp.]|jgi:predicted nucleotidyltransferase|nr:nucleotidyltransferase domain-containing protein [Candidatus Methanoplasma sp.]